ncbi:MAG TPA: hypothetical protein VHD56_17665 [Tepidisphaeraceae bacterium]|nr:hypothetical protein [Tepidisphaeraceae bacterium]
MTNILPGSGYPSLPKPAGTASEHILVRHVLHRVLAFTRRTIHDVINDPIARNQVIGYYKLHRWIERESEISDLERQWNSI